MMAAQASKTESRRDVEVRRQRKEMEKQVQELEKRVKRKRDTSRDRGSSSKSSKRKRQVSEEDDDGHEAVSSENESVSGEEEEEEEEEESGEEASDSEEESESDTASEHSGATPEHDDDDDVEEEDGADRDRDQAESDGQEAGEVADRTDDDEDSAEDELEREGRKAEGKWRERQERTPTRPGEVSRTPSRSPTPRRMSGDEDDPAYAAGLAEENVGDRSPISQGSGNLSGSRPASQPQSSRHGSPQPQGAQGEQEPEQEDDERERLPDYLPSINGCRSVEEYHCLNKIEEGTYGVVYRARDKKTKEIVALKRLKMEREKEGFPITSLREVNTLLISQHTNVVHVREIVVGSNMDMIFIVMDFVEHDMKALMETMRAKKQVFLPGEVKCLMLQLLSAIHHLHDNWILHRDLKTSNLLLSHNGILKVGDFGLAREYGSPLRAYTSVVVTLWYRAPELLLGTKEYSTPIDVWSIGCIFGEFLLMEPLFPAKSEVDQLNRIFKLLGTPSEKIWPGYNKLPVVQKMPFVDYPLSHLRNKFPREMLSEKGMALLKRFLTYNPKQRITCRQALDDVYFDETPVAIEPSMFPTWPAKSEGSQPTKKAASPKPPSGGGAFKKINDDDVEARLNTGFSLNANAPPVAAGWNLRF